MGDVLDGVTVDALFAAERDEIRMKRKECKLGFERLDAKSNKFTISQSATTETKVTLMDVLFDRVLRDKETTKNMVIRCRQFLDQNSYDSDALEWDIEDERDSNICSVIESQFKFAVDSMKTFIRSTKLSRSAFSTGFVFDYWNRWPPFEATSHYRQYPDDAIPIKPKYDSLKQEVLESGYLDPSQWMEFVDLKAMKYLKSKKVRKMTAKRADFGTTTGQIGRGQPLSQQHLCSVILYCDFGPLCSAFSATLRLENFFEDLESLTLRHSKFAHFGKLLSETVVDHGINGVKYKDRDYERGPFFLRYKLYIKLWNLCHHLKGSLLNQHGTECRFKFCKK